MDRYASREFPGRPASLWERAQGIGRSLAGCAVIAGIVSLGFLFWSSVATLPSVWTDTRGAIATALPPPPTSAAEVLPTLPPSATPATATLPATDVPSAPALPNPGDTPTSAQPVPTLTPTTAGASSTPTALDPTLTPTPLGTLFAPTPSPVQTPQGRAPWILLPSPAPNSAVSVGRTVIEARGRGDAAIVGVTLSLDGASLPVTLDPRSDQILRGFATVPITAGAHHVSATATDAAGRSGTFAWTFTAS